jgi:hypothetical protein
MHLLSRSALCLLVALGLLVTGCRKQRLDEESTLTVPPGEAQSKIVDAPRAEQQVTATVSSPGAPVSAYLVLEKNRSAAQDALLNGKRPANVLDGKDKVEEASLQGTVPAGEEFAVVVSNAGSKNAQVKVKITGR